MAVFPLKPQRLADLLSRSALWLQSIKTELRIFYISSSHPVLTAPSPFSVCRIVSEGAEEAERERTVGQINGHIVTTAKPHFVRNAAWKCLGNSNGFGLFYFLWKTSGLFNGGVEKKAK